MFRLKYNGCLGRIVCFNGDGKQFVIYKAGTNKNDWSLPTSTHHSAPENSCQDPNWTKETCAIYEPNKSEVICARGKKHNHRFLNDDGVDPVIVSVVILRN